ncbi:hypothetical protein FGADI_1679 [Fusarium gaditjirri]|uniref:Uncharacterized protein n=1 Tax=Fusarium gaditjirri TaxID=282569 RepID=A0A8H4TJZ4_9HYPO|nr:hypothetical protein FGADI_1679 [Fusarium gaditjirri]
MPQSSNQHYYYIRLIVELFFFMETPRRPCTYSFGENGTTAIVSPSGRLLRITQHFPGHPCGYCVDHSSILRPYAVVDRITPFLSSINDPDHTIGFFPDQEWLGSGAEGISVEMKDYRWPFFKVNRSTGPVDIQYFVSEGVIHQTFTFENGLPDMALRTNMLIRELEFSTNENSFNNAGFEDYYSTQPLGDHRCIQRVHGNVVLFIAAYVENIAVVFKKNDGTGNESNDSETYHVDLSGAKYPNSLSITFVYALELFMANSPHHMPTRFLLDNPPTKRAFLNLDMQKERPFTAESSLDGCLRLNLEHILSVCSIPVYPDAESNDDPAIAFTCGDVDDHRVATAASFSYMAERIRKLLKGHLKWLFEEDYRDLASDPSCPHIWVNGKEILNWKDSEYFPPASLVDAPFHLIKAGDFFEYDQGKTWKVPQSAGIAFQTWIKELDPKNKLGSYAFPRNMDDPTHSFYLTDHVLIWRAIKAAESLGLKSCLFVDITPEATREGDKGGQSSKKPEQRHYSSTKIQNQILKRFTAENPVSKKRMLSVSRSPGHIRFLLRTKDTSLFHAMDCGFFDKPGISSTADEWHNKIDIWKNLIDCQRLHDDNDDISWDEPVRFALSVAIAQKGRCINSLPPQEMLKRAITVLMDSSWDNGLFPGQLDVNGEPAIYNEELIRDKYWSNTFEVPFTLWKFMQSSAKAPTTDPSQQHKSTPVTTQDPEF